ncbi:hypothetical protein MTE01_04880 [Microbacterium testaceum]|uniref:Uncharacterized protein n=1 Tax=Microbacterium testaceum TaxID=2033 RepID=A0A4Y3QIP7_MICTE|nr:hypothetical protein [Microbacterium testaceum]GEB44543.1 hypothetical protein MTE01_04880 [Microbacterium testaceum]
MSDSQNSAPADDATDLGDDPTVKPSQENDVDEEAKAPSKDDPSADHRATGIGVIGDE